MLTQTSAGVSSNTLQTEAKSAEEMKANLFDNSDSNIEDWTDTYKTNVPQCFFMTMGFLPLLQKSTEHQHGYSGCVINVSQTPRLVLAVCQGFCCQRNVSSATLQHILMLFQICSISGIVKTAQHHFAYNASKAAVIHLTKMLGFEIGNNGLKVRVNSIAPGVFPSEMTQGESGENQKSELPKEDFEGKVFAQRPGNDRDM